MTARSKTRPTRKNRDLRAIAKSIVDDAIQRIEHTPIRERGRWPKTKDFVARYGLNDQQTQKVKKHAKEYAASLGYIWGYHPESGTFRIARGDLRVARELLHYSNKCISWQAQGAQAQVAGAHKGGLIDDDDRKALTKVYGQVDRLADRADKMLEEM